MDRSSLLWKLNRLRAMGLPEILYRVRQSASARLESHGWGLARVPADHGEIFGRPWLAGLDQGLQIDSVPYVAAANKILDGRFRIFSMDNACIGFPPDWNRDPKTGTQAPMVFGKSIDYRLERNVGDIKYLWEPNRHLELVTLAQAWYLTRHNKYLDGCRKLLDTWMNQCPYPFGPNWISSLEHAIRLLNWSFAWHLLGGPISPLFAGNDRQHSGSDGWTASTSIATLFVVTCLYTLQQTTTCLASTWVYMLPLSLGQYGLKAGNGRFLKCRLEREAQIQNAEDGVNREQSIWYHHEVADMMLLSGLIGRANGDEFGSGFWRRLELMLEFIQSMLAFGRHVPMIGDADDAVMVRLGMG